MCSGHLSLCFQARLPFTSIGDQKVQYVFNLCIIDARFEIKLKDLSEKKQKQNYVKQFIIDKQIIISISYL